LPLKIVNNNKNLMKKAMMCPKSGVWCIGEGPTMGAFQNWDPQG